MVNIVTDGSLQQITQHLRLTPIQWQAACLYLETQESLAYCHHYALGDAFGLSFSQWRQVQAYVREQAFLQALPAIEKSHVPQVARFLPFDIAMSTHYPLSNRLKAYSEEQLKGFIDTLLANRDHHPLSLLKECFEDGDEDMLSEMRSLLLLKRCETVDLLQSLRQSLFINAHVELQLSPKANDTAKALLADWPNPAPLIKKINPSLVLRFWDLKKSGQVQLVFVHSQGEDWGRQAIAEKLSWVMQDKAADAWIQSAIDALWEQYLQKILNRDLMAIIYDTMVDQMMPIAELKWRQVLMFKGVGAKPVLLMYPHGRSGVMLLAVNAAGEVLDDVMIYPYAPDYNAEQTVVILAKLMIKHHIEDIGLVAKPETRKVLQKSLNTFKLRYSDLNWHLTIIPGDYTQVIMNSQAKQPAVEEIVKVAHFLQNPEVIWTQVSAFQWLSPRMKCLPKAMLAQVWKELLLSYAYQNGLDVNTTAAHVLTFYGLNADQIIAKRPYTSREEVRLALEQSPQEFSRWAGMLSVGNSFDNTPLLPEDRPLLDTFSQQLHVSVEQLLQQPKPLATLTDERAKRMLALLNLRHFKVEVLSNNVPQQLAEIPSGTCFRGMVTKVMSYGVFVDLGEGVEGLMHISAMGNHYVNDLQYLFASGDVIVAEWLEYDLTQKRLSLKFPLLKSAPIVPKNKAPVRKETKKPQTVKTQKPEPQKKGPEAPNAMQLAFKKLKSDSVVN